MESIAQIGMYLPSIMTSEITQEIPYDQGEIAGRKFYAAIL